MNNRHPTPADAEVLSPPAAARLLERASELDAARRAGSAVTDLRAAAAEAGISAHAFDAALAELQAGAQLPRTDAHVRPRRARWLARGAAIAALLAVAAIAASRVFFTVSAPAASVSPIVEEAILLRCLSPGEAADLVRPLLRSRANTVVASRAGGTRVLTIRATPAQLQEVKATLDRYERADSPACTVRPGFPTP